MNSNIILCLIMIVLIIIIVNQYYSIKKLNKKLLLLKKGNETLYSIENESSMSGLCDVMLSIAIDLIPYAEKGSMLILEDDDKFHFKAIRGFSKELKNISLDREEVFLHETSNFRDTVIINNPSNFDERYMNTEKKYIFENFNALNIKCTLSSPIYVDKNLIGVINLDSINPNKMFTKVDMETMNYIRNEFELILKNFIIQEELRHMANYDDLTGIYNRRRFRYIFNNQLSYTRKNNTRLCLALIDIDDFKSINDKYGHNIGDEALKHFTHVLKRQVKDMGTYARISGDEFVVLFKGCSESEAKEILSNMKKLLAQEKLKDIKVNFSYGVCEITNEKMLSIDEILEIADKNMYKNKKTKCKNINI
ncbi:sensor domain-containing diguanylate cyclase [Clostridium aestuarii]|uniref:Sensor domain-containing diguanylate cyclase n=1 Tax=Clostridium aestuarii TaxID=338193 RepID=A0ABT4D4G3_9CLOT|nr:sensor domain-containing diguanylate cyclase [Clostridium aestuarii]MCY6484928.1 sensor domain-containing diguanylate cyclase [Clostridium aestuarii]